MVLSTRTVLHGVEKANLESGEKGGFQSPCAGKLGKALESRPRDEELSTYQYSVPGEKHRSEKARRAALLHSTCLPSQKPFRICPTTVWFHLGTWPMELPPKHTSTFARS